MKLKMFAACLGALVASCSDSSTPPAADRAASRAAVLPSLVEIELKLAEAVQAHDGFVIVRRPDLFMALALPGQAWMVNCGLGLELQFRSGENETSVPLAEPALFSVEDCDKILPGVARLVVRHLTPKAPRSVAATAGQP